MTVDIRGQPNLGMPELILYNVQRYSCGRHVRRCGVAKFVETNFGDSTIPAEDL